MLRNVFLDILCSSLNIRINVPEVCHKNNFCIWRRSQSWVVLTLFCPKVTAVSSHFNFKWVDSKTSLIHWTVESTKINKRLHFPKDVNKMKFDGLNRMSSARKSRNVHLHLVHDTKFTYSKCKIFLCMSGFKRFLHFHDGNK